MDHGMHGVPLGAGSSGTDVIAHRLAPRCSTSSSRYFTRSPIETKADQMRRRRARASGGSGAKVMTSRASRTAVVGSAVMGGAVITASLTFRSSAPAPCLATQ